MNYVFRKLVTEKYNFLIKLSARFVYKMEA